MIGILRHQKMSTDETAALSRRDFLRTGAAAAGAVGIAGVALGSCAVGGGGIGIGTDAGADVLLEPTPQCLETQDNILGPFYIPGAPTRSNLVEAGMAGTVLVLSGHVQGPACQPLAGAMLDFWQANDAGMYDNVGWTLRGKLFTDGAGFYQLQTIIPGLYPGRTRHIHVRASAPGYQLLTTQLYFAGEPANATDAFIRPSLEMTTSDGPGGVKLADFEFVIVPA